MPIYLKDIKKLVINCYLKMKMLVSILIVEKLLGYGEKLNLLVSLIIMQIITICIININSNLDITTIVKILMFEHINIEIAPQETIIIIKINKIISLILGSLLINLMSRKYNR